MASSTCCPPGSWEDPPDDERTGYKGKQISLGGDSKTPAYCVSPAITDKEESDDKKGLCCSPMFGDSGLGSLKSAISLLVMDIM